MKILLITGWGGGTKLLKPLCDALHNFGHLVEVWNIFDGLDANVLNEKAQQAQNFDVIAGWSLGGQLATLLVQVLSEQYAMQKLLITLASNPCFIQQQDWPYAMSLDAFVDFQHSVEHQPIETLTKFGMNVCHGTKTLKQDYQTFIQYVEPQNMRILQAGLNCLKQFNHLEYLQQNEGKQCHFFAENDALVNVNIADELSTKMPNAKIVRIQGSHACVLFEAQTIASAIDQFLGTELKS